MINHVPTRSDMLRRRAIWGLLWLSIVANTLPFAVPAAAPTFHLIASLVLYPVLFLVLTPSLSIQRQALVGLTLVPGAAMTVVIAVRSFALVFYLVAVCALLAASIVAAALLITERRQT
jgi:hypothetical protein